MIIPSALQNICRLDDNDRRFDAADDDDEADANADDDDDGADGDVGDNDDNDDDDVDSDVAISGYLLSDLSPICLISVDILTVLCFGLLSFLPFIDDDNTDADPV